MAPSFSGLGRPRACRRTQNASSSVVVVPTARPSLVKAHLFARLRCSTSLPVVVLVDAAQSPDAIAEIEAATAGRSEAHAMSQESLRQRYGEKVENFAGSPPSAPSKLAAIDWFVHASHYEWLWHLEDDVWVRDFDALVAQYGGSDADLLIKSARGPARDGMPFWYESGWKVGSRRHGVSDAFRFASLAIYRMSRRCAAAVLATIRSEPDTSHHEIFLPFVISVSPHLTLQPLEDRHAATLHFNTRFKSATDFPSLCEAELRLDYEVFHPIKRLGGSECASSVALARRGFGHREQARWLAGPNDFSACARPLANATTLLTTVATSAYDLRNAAELAAGARPLFRCAAVALSLQAAAALEAAPQPLLRNLPLPAAAAAWQAAPCWRRSGFAGWRQDNALWMAALKYLLARGFSALIVDCHVRFSGADLLPAMLGLRRDVVAARDWRGFFLQPMGVGHERIPQESFAEYFVFALLAFSSGLEGILFVADGLGHERIPQNSFKEYFVFALLAFSSFDSCVGLEGFLFVAWVCADVLLFPPQG